MIQENKLRPQSEDESNEEYRTKKARRMGIWVTENFYSNLQILQQAYPEFTLNELLYFITGTQIEFLKDSDSWKKSNELVKRLDKSKKAFILDSNK